MGKRRRFGEWCVLAAFRRRPVGVALARAWKCSEPGLRATALPDRQSPHSRSLPPVHRFPIFLSSMFLSFLPRWESLAGGAEQETQGRKIDGRKIRTRRCGIFLPSIFLPLPPRTGILRVSLLEDYDAHVGFSLGIASRWRID